MNPRSLITLVLLVSTLTCWGKDYRLQTLETANDLFRSATNETMYAEAARQYQYLVEEDGIRNGKLFYTLGNSWFMAGDIGRSILNYRRAEQYRPNDDDVQHNMASALALRVDLIPEKEPHPLAMRFFGWHLRTSSILRWGLFASFWLVFWGAWYWMRRSAKKEARVTTVVAGCVSLVLLASLIVEALIKQRSQPGVIVAGEVLARKGDGTMYAPAFMEPLHSGTEFQQLDDRKNWWHIRLADGQACWIPESAAELVALSSK